MSKIILTLAASAFVALLLFKLKVPGGVLVGAIIGSSIAHIIIGESGMGIEVKVFAQIIAGAFIGCSLDRSDLSLLKTCTRPMIVMFFSLIVVNMLLGLILWKTGLSDALTCFMCGIPGGTSDITLMAVDFGANVSVVFIIHFARMLAGIGIFPALIQKISTSDPHSESALQAKEITAKREKGSQNILLPFVIAFSALLGIVARKIGIPSGALVFSILGALTFKLFGAEVHFPRWLKRFAQIMSGAYIGSLFRIDSFDNVILIIISIIITILIYFINAYLVGKYLNRKWQIPLNEAMLIMTPAGASDMALISSDIGVMSSRLILLQIMRLIVVTAVFPYINLAVSTLF